MCFSQIFLNMPMIFLSTKNAYEVTKTRKLDVACYLFKMLFFEITLGVRFVICPPLLNQSIPVIGLLLWRKDYRLNTLFSLSFMLLIIQVGALEEAVRYGRIELAKFFELSEFDMLVQVKRKSPLPELRCYYYFLRILLMDRNMYFWWLFNNLY